MTASVVLGNASFEKGYIMNPLSIKSILGRNYKGNILPTPCNVLSTQPLFALYTCLEQNKLNLPFSEIPTQDNQNLH